MFFRCLFSRCDETKEQKDALAERVPICLETSSKHTAKWIQRLPLLPLDHDTWLKLFRYLYDPSSIYGEL